VGVARRRAAAPAPLGATKLTEPPIAASAGERVPFVDLGRQHASLAEELHCALDRVIGASAFVLGEEVELFEEEFAAYCGTEHCVGVASGTAALMLSLKAAGIEAGDEVIVPAHTFIASALAVVHAGATPVFCDVDEGTGLIDPDAAASVVGPRAAAVLAVHLYGQACDIDALGALAGRHGLLLVEDAAQAHGAVHRGRRAGSLGHAGCFSFYPSKNLGALGDGGAICTDDPAIARRARQLRNLGQLRKGDHAVAGHNERLDGLQAAMLRAKLRRLDGWNERRRAHAARYRRMLPSDLRPLVERPESPCVYHLFPVRVQDRRRLASRLAAAGVETGVHYSPALPEQPPFVRDAPPIESFPAAAAWAAEELSLPMFAELESPELERVAGACAAALEPQMVRS
jgi:dTDP-3-amino-3,4,6-trideoxy-alpha-D-glucose transaminase